MVRHYEDGGENLSIEYVKKTWRGWKWVYGGGQTTSNFRLDLPEKKARTESFSYLYLPSPKKSKYGNTPFPLLGGIITHPDIVRIVVRDDQSKLERQAKIVKIDNRFKLYYVFLEQSQGKKFDIIGYDNGGNELKVQTIDESLQSGSSSGTSKIGD